MRLDFVQMDVNHERICVGIEDSLMRLKLKISSVKDAIVRAQDQELQTDEKIMAKLREEEEYKQILKQINKSAI